MTAFWHRFTKGWKQPAKIAEEGKKEGASADQETPADSALPSVQPAGAGKAHATGAAYRVLIGPHITERTTALGAHGQYAFKVHARATKAEIAQAVRMVYRVHPTAVNVAITPGKRVRFGRASGRRSDAKKAIVTLRKGESIAVHKGV